MGASEFDLIRKYFAPLADDLDASFALGDDAALLPIGADPGAVRADPDRARLVACKDVLVADVHFRRSDPPDAIAKKALRVNLSDIAAMGATPLGYLLGCAWPKGVREEYVALFAEGLRQDQSAYRLTAFGGDTTAHADPAAPLVVSVTAFGAAPQSGVLRRSGARPGDDVYVSGTIGDAGLGLDVHRARVVGTDAESLANRYLLPQPRLALGRSLAGVAAAAIDVSDGLLADAGHIAEQSGVRIDVDIDNAPLSPAARAWLDRQPNRREAIGFLLSCGDDYELLFTARPEQRKAIAEAAAAAATPVRRIGRVGEGEGVATIDSAGDEVFLPKSGFDHFASS